MTTVHVLPENDLKEHTESEECECKPTVRYVNSGRLVIHNSYDGREVIEQWEEEKGRIVQ